MKGRRVVLAVTLLLVAVPLVQAGPINPVWEYASSSFSSDSRPFTLGFEFTTSVTYQINALGYWDDGADHPVGLWDTVGNLLVSTTVLSTDPVYGHFAYDPVSYTLVPGTYRIGGLFNGGPFPELATGVTSLPGYTWINDEQQGGPVLTFPTVATNGGYGTNGLPIVDFSVQTGVPEPSSLLLLVGGLMVVGGGVLRRRRP